MTDLHLAAPRDDLIRMAPGFEVEVRASGDGDGRTLFGYGAVFNSDAVIDSWEGKFVERIAPGAFKKTLKERGDQVKIMFNHGMDPQIGDKPLGKASVLKEDKTGLYVEVPLSRTSYNEDLLALLNDGALDGMSFRFAVVKDEWEEPKRKDQLPIRTIIECRLYELGPVTSPAYLAAAAGVRSRDEFTIWRSLPEAKQEAIRTILGTSAATPLVGAGDEAALEAPAVAPAEQVTRTGLIPNERERVLRLAGVITCP